MSAVQNAQAQVFDVELDSSSKSRSRRPAVGTVRANILAALEAGRTLTSKEAWIEFGTARLAADVHALRRMGWPIISVEVKVPTRRGYSRVAEYCLGEGPGGDTARA